MLKIRFRRAAPEPGLLLAVPVREGAAPPERFHAAAQAAGFTGHDGQAVQLFLPQPTWLIGAGQAATALEWERVGGAAAAAASATPHLVLDARGLPPEAASALAAGAALRAWRFTRHRSRDVEPGLERVTLLVDEPSALAAPWARAEAAVSGALLARELTAEPANHLSTRHFAKRLEALVEHGLHVDVWGRKRLSRAGLGALLAVGRAAASPPKLAILRWRGSFDAPPVVLVGKGVVFDTGGLSIKPAAGMAEMKADMAGAAACAGAMLALALRRCPAPVVALLPLAENAVGTDAYRPGDVLTAHGGRTIEVVDTDAEGRLILADALSLAAATLRPRAIVDVATLTGSIIIALGHHRAGLFSNDAALAASLAAAGEAVGEPVWPMPIGDRHREDLNSDIADIRQCAPAGSGAGGGRLLPDACHAAAFLREFTGGCPWAHLDIAGMDQREDADALGPKGPSGFGARLLDALIAARFEEPDHHAPAEGVKAT